MQTTNPTNAEQEQHWGGAGADGWVELKGLIDGLFAPFAELLIAELSAGSASRVLDVGCGTGGTTLAAARRLGPMAECVGVDISEPMLVAARAYAQKEGVPARFICGDAQSYEFASAYFDQVVSRFGVMFFDDPVRAFTNLRRSAKESGRLRFVAWRSPAENPFMMTAERAVAPLLPAMPPRQPDAPGQFAFASRDRVLGILRQSGWVDLDIQPVDIECAVPQRDLTRYVTKLGPLVRVLPQLDATLRARVIETACAAFAPYVRGDEVRFVAACWLVGASAAAR